jgi:hypothetical protein
VRSIRLLVYPFSLTSSFTLSSLLDQWIIRSPCEEDKRGVLVFLIWVVGEKSRGERGGCCGEESFFWLETHGVSGFV